MSNRQVAGVYRTIIDSVITSIRPEFDEVGIEEAVLQELLRSWEYKVATSRVADFSGDAAMAPHARQFPMLSAAAVRATAAPAQPVARAAPARDAKASKDDDEINSDLDDPDEEEQDQDVEGDHDGDLVIALYEKVRKELDQQRLTTAQVQRVKNKWKIVLKDGLINVGGKDYLFAKCSGFVWPRARCELTVPVNSSGDRRCCCNRAVLPFVPRVTIPSPARTYVQLEPTSFSLPPSCSLPELSSVAPPRSCRSVGTPRPPWETSSCPSFSRMRSVSLPCAAPRSAHVRRPSSRARTCSRSISQLRPETWGQSRPLLPASPPAPLRRWYWTTARPSPPRSHCPSRPAADGPSLLSNHVASIEALKPGMLEVFEGPGPDSKKWFGESIRSRCTFRADDAVSGGFANMNPDNTLTINAVEAYPIDAFSAEVRSQLPPCSWRRARTRQGDDGSRADSLQAIKSGLAEAQRVAAGSGSEVEKAEARVEVEVFEALQASIARV